MQDLRIENIIYRLNNLAENRKELFDQLWLTEQTAQDLRRELLKLIEGKKDN